MSTQPNPTPHQDLDGALQSHSPALSARYARFGAFLADFERAELYQNGERVKVQAKLFQALALLLRRAGDVVTREDVRRELWPETLLTNVDANVNTTFNKLRQVLGDSSENPMYVETIPRRGYSFIGLVEFSNSFANTIPTKVNVKPAAEPHVETTQLPYKRFVLVRVISLLFGGMILGALLTLFWLFAQAKYHRASTTASINMSANDMKFEHDSRTDYNALM